MASRLREGTRDRAAVVELREDERARDHVCHQDDDGGRDSCGPAGVQCVNETTTQKVAGARPDAEQGEQGDRDLPLEALEPDAGGADGQRDGQEAGRRAARRSQIHQSDEPKSFQSGRCGSRARTARSRRGSRGANSCRLVTILTPHLPKMVVAHGGVFGGRASIPMAAWCGRGRIRSTRGRSPKQALGEEAGVAVTRVVLGCGNLGGIVSKLSLFGQGTTREEALRLLDAAGELGITTLDTADADGGGRSESFIGDWLCMKGGDVRDRVVIVTKTFNPMEEGADRGLSRTRIRRQVGTSLERLGVERLPLYMAHSFDPDTAQEETLATFDELVREGVVGAVGATNFTAEQVAEALELSALEGLTRYEWVQNASRSSRATARRRSRCATSTGSATPRSAHWPAAG